MMPFTSTQPRLHHAEARLPRRAPVASPRRCCLQYYQGKPSGQIIAKRLQVGASVAAAVKKLYPMITAQHTDQQTGGDREWINLGFINRITFEPVVISSSRLSLHTSDLPIVSMVIVGDVLPTGMEKIERANWAGNIVYNGALHEITSPEQIPAVVRSLEKVSAVGTGHTFNYIADSPYNQISLRLLHEVVALDEPNRTVTVQAGTTYDQLCPYLHSKGYALHNLASLTQLSIVGACSTATHGSGDRNGNLATPVSALELVTADGASVKLSRHDDDFFAVLVGLGAFGVITQISLDIHPSFSMRQFVYEALPFIQLRERFDVIMGSAYSVSVFTDWQNEGNNEVWVKSRVSDGERFGEELYGARLATEKLHPVRSMSAETCTEQMGVVGDAFERLPHFRMGCTPSVGEELQSEYFMPRDRAAGAILALERLGDAICPNVFTSEIRTVAGDGFWMSTCYGRASVAIGFTWKPDWPAIQRLLPEIERVLAPFDPRPHWGKLFHFSPSELQAKYEKMDDFVQLAAKYDPKGKFRNEFLNSYIFTS